MNLLIRYTVFILLIFSNFLVMGVKPPEKHEKEHKLHKRQKIHSEKKGTFSTESEAKKSRKKKLSKNSKTSYILNLTQESLHNIFYFLDPLEIICFSQSCATTYNMISHDFWNKYLGYHGQQSWDTDTPLVKVVVAHALFRDGYTQQAAKLGLPIALEIENDEYIEVDNESYIERSNPVFKKSKSKKKWIFNFVWDSIGSLSNLQLLPAPPLHLFGEGYRSKKLTSD